jgi:hypothetical protein
MTPRTSRALLLLSIAAIAPAASAQFDNQWATFVRDNNRLKDSTGAAASYIANDAQEKDMAWGDLDRDGWIDLVIVRKQPFTTGGAFPNYLLMNENGVLVDRSAQYASDTDVAGDNGFMTATNDRDVVFTDVNLDGWLDVVTCTTLGDGLPKHISHPRVYRNKGNDANGNWLGLRFENFRIPQFSIAPHFCGVAAGDVTGDGFPDLYFADYGSLSDKLLLNDGTGTFTDSGVSRMSAGMLDAAFGDAARIIDMNGDGAADIVRSSGVTGVGAGPLVSVAYNNPTNLGFFPANLFQPDISNGSPYHVDVGDLNRDNKPDVIISDDGSDGYRYNTGVDALGRVIWGLNKTYSFVTGGDDGFAGTCLVVDLNDDGWNDSIHADVDVDIGGCSRRCHIYHNPGGAIGAQITLREEAGSAGNPWRGAVGFLAGDLTGTYDAAAFDLDNDGDKDIVMGRCNGTFVWINQLYSPPVYPAFCPGDGSGTACPCANNSVPGNNEGCLNSLGNGGKLVAAGLARVSQDLFVLTGSNMPNSSALYFQGTSQISGGAGAVFGDGLRCAGGSVLRLGTKFNFAGTSQYPAAGEQSVSVRGVVSAGDTRTYQVWYRNAADFCTPSTFNLTNGVQATWTP